MPGTLRHVDPSTPPSAFTMAWSRMSATRPALFVSRHVSWKLDPWLLRMTGGRVSSTVTIPTAVLETTGAKSGLRRRNAVIYFHDGEKVTVVPSQAGASSHPAWFHNLVAHPDVTVNGIPMVAAVVEDEADRTRLWALADRVFPAFEGYRRTAARTGRTIPIVQLTARP